MRLLLSILVIVLLASETFSLETSLGPGLSVKNALVYMVTALLVLRAAVSGDVFRMELKGITLCFALLIGLAVVSMLVAALIIEYPRYELFAAVVPLKNNLVDHLIFLLTFFYGARTSDDALAIGRIFLIALFGANAITVLDASGLVSLGVIATKGGAEAGRVHGALGEANQYAATLVYVLPAFAAAAAVLRGPARRAFWLLALCTTVAALLMTVSRGAYVGLAAATIGGILLFRHRLRPAHLLRWGAAAVVVLGVVLFALRGDFGQLLWDRVVEQTLSLDRTVASSGRTAVWGAALEVMARSPWTFITGFGWNVYSVMPFRFAPHNSYLGLWFNLGLLGLTAFVLILVQLVARAKQASEVAPPEPRAFLIAFALGVIALAVSIFFVDLHTPWLFVWIFAGLMMRVAVEQTASATARSAAAAAARPRPAPPLSARSGRGAPAPAATRRALR